MCIYVFVFAYVCVCVCVPICEGTITIPMMKVEMNVNEGCGVSGYAKACVCVREVGEKTKAFGHRYDRGCGRDQLIVSRPFHTAFDNALG